VRDYSDISASFVGSAKSAPVLGRVEAQDAPTLSLPDKPSIAVLPFENLSGDPEQEYFADGIVEDIITALSRFALAVRYRAQFELHVQGPGCRR
jgi:TolB-like protein